MGEGKDTLSDHNPSGQGFQAGPMYEMIAQNTSDATVQLDTDQRITFANFAAERMLGHDTAALSGRNLDELLHPFPIGL